MDNEIIVIFNNNILELHFEFDIIFKNNNLIEFEIIKTRMLDYKIDLIAFSSLFK